MSTSIDSRELLALLASRSCSINDWPYAGMLSQVMVHMHYVQCCKTLNSTFSELRLRDMAFMRRCIFSVRVTNSGTPYKASHRILSAVIACGGCMCSRMTKEISCPLSLLGPLGTERHWTR